MVAVLEAAGRVDTLVVVVAELVVVAMAGVAMRVAELVAVAVAVVVAALVVALWWRTW